MHLSVGFPKPWSAVARESAVQFFFRSLNKFVFRNAHFGRSLAQLILAALSLYPFEVKEGPERRFLSDVPFCRFRLPGTKLGCIFSRLGNRAEEAMGPWVGLGSWVDSSLLELPALDSCFPRSSGLDSCLPRLLGLQRLAGHPVTSFLRSFSPFPPVAS